MKEGKVLQFYLNNQVTHIIFSNSQYFSKNRGVLRFSLNRIASTRNIRNNSFVMHLARPRRSFYFIRHKKIYSVLSKKKNRRQPLLFENYCKYEKTIFAVVLVAENRKNFPPFWQLCALVPIGLVNRKSARDYSALYACKCHSRNLQYDFIHSYLCCATMQFYVNRTSFDVILARRSPKSRSLRWKAKTRQVVRKLSFVSQGNNNVFSFALFYCGYFYFYF